MLAVVGDHCRCFEHTSESEDSAAEVTKTSSSRGKSCASKAENLKGPVVERAAKFKSVTESAAESESMD